MDQLQKASLLLSHGAVMLDIRTTNEYQHQHLCRAYNIPTPLPPLSQKEKKLLFQKLKQFITENNLSKRVPIIVYCKKGIRAAEAKKQLHLLGMKYVMNLGGVEEEPLKKIMRGEIDFPFLTTCPNSNKHPNGK